MALEDDMGALAIAPLFSLMPEDALRLIAFAAEHQTLNAGDVLFTKGEPSNGGFVVTKGAVALEADREPSFVAELGALIGRTALFAPTRRPATARARKESAVLCIAPALMRRVLQEFPATVDEIRAAMTDELATVSDGLARVRQALLAIDGET
jgi:CRP-like cAMP-binding protein